MIASSLSYGSDHSGLVWGYQFSRDGQATPIKDGASAQGLLDAGRDGSSAFTWLHFNLSRASTEKWLRQHVALAPQFYEALHQGSRSTRIELVDDTLIAVVNDVLHGFSFDPSEIATLWVSVTPTLVVSARRKPLRSVDHLRLAVEQGALIRTPIELLTHLLRDQADVLIDIVRSTITKVDQIEDAFLSARLDAQRANLGALRRVLVRLQRLMAPEPGALFRLLQRPPAWMTEADVQDLRQSSEEFSAVLLDMTSLQERIKLLQEEIAAMINEKNSQSLYTLTIVTVLAVPVNIIAGLFGMNVSGIPLASHPQGFWLVVAVLVVMISAAAWILGGKRKDL